MLKKFIAPLVLSGALLGSITIGGAASAGTPTSITTDNGTSSTTSTVSAPAGAHKHAVHAWLKANRKSLRKAAVTISAATIGITAQALVTELKSGMSIAQVAVEHHSTAQAVIDALTAAADARVAQAVSAGTLTQHQGVKISAALAAHVVKLVNHVR